MSSPVAFAVLAALPLSLALAGYRLAAFLRSGTAGERLAFAILAGLALLLLNLGVANFFVPLSPLASALCLWPIPLAFVERATRQQLAADVASLLRTPRGRWAAILFIASPAFISAPELRQPDLLFYDGTGSHDGYFWISGAKWLQAHSYMETPAPDADHPWSSFAYAFSGWQPDWGRAAAENLLAAVASLTARDPVEIYLPATAALFAAWSAAVYLVAKTFWITRLTPAALFALFALQPLFVFFRANGNLPNLLGALAGAAVVVSTARALSSTLSRGPWLALLALSAHALLHSYPELVPFIALPGALLLARAAVQRHHTVVPVVLATFAGAALNPAVTVRAFHGFVHSFINARLDIDWVDTFARLHPFQYPPALASLSIPAALFLGTAVGLLVSILLIAALVSALHHAVDRFGAVASLSGGAILLLYTVVADFSYGWQKSAQFSAIFLAAALPVATAASLRSRPPGSPRRRSIFSIAVSAAALGVFALGVTFHGLEMHKGSHRKRLTRDWLHLRDYATAHLRSDLVRIEPSTFPSAFFHSMWATYFLPDARVVFPADADRPGGYLHVFVRPAAPAHSSAPIAILAGPNAPQSPWAGHPVLFSGPDFSLFDAANIRLPDNPE